MGLVKVVAATAATRTCVIEWSGLLRESKKPCKRGPAVGI